MPNGNHAQLSRRTWINSKENWLFTRIGIWIHYTYPDPDFEDQNAPLYSELHMYEKSSFWFLSHFSSPEGFIQVFVLLIKNNQNVKSSFCGLFNLGLKNIAFSLHSTSCSVIVLQQLSLPWLYPVHPCFLPFIYSSNSCLYLSL
jgi:hypothetical protein